MVGDDRCPSVTPEELVAEFGPKVAQKIVLLFEGLRVPTPLKFEERVLRPKRDKRICARYARGETALSLSYEYGVSKRTIQRIVREK